jgi:hypothetical protein
MREPTFDGSGGGTFNVGTLFHEVMHGQSGLEDLSLLVQPDPTRILAGLIALLVRPTRLLGSAIVRSVTYPLFHERTYHYFDSGLECPYS